MDIDPSIAAELEKYGSSSDDYFLMVEMLGREPNELELAIIATMLCEHISYRYSKLLLNRMFDELEIE